MSPIRTSVLSLALLLLRITFLTLFFFFFFNDTATTEIYTLSLHDALPISPAAHRCGPFCSSATSVHPPPRRSARSEEHTSELQSRRDLVCRLLLEKKKKKKKNIIHVWMHMILYSRSLRMSYMCHISALY